MTDDGGFIVPDYIVEKMYAYAMVSNEFLEDLFRPPLMGRGLVYWQQREREMVEAQRVARRVQRTIWRARRFVQDWPRRLRNAGAALAGEWERSDDD